MPDAAIATRQSAGNLVRDYLSTMERRDLAGAATLLAPGFRMTFPGGRVFERLEDFVAYSRPRYARVGKRYDRFDEVPAADGTVVYCFGTLHGAWPDGTPFEGIRFIDRFTVRDGLLVDQMVWNDRAEMAPEGAR